MATNAGGVLPPNIVNPLWAAIQDMPAGFADGVDDGITGLKVTRVVGAEGSAFSAGEFGFGPDVTCPTGSVLVGGGALVSGTIGETALLGSYPANATTWSSLAYKDLGATGENLTIPRAIGEAAQHLETGGCGRGERGRPA